MTRLLNGIPVTSQRPFDLLRREWNSSSVNENSRFLDGAVRFARRYVSFHRDMKEGRFFLELLPELHPKANVASCFSVSMSRILHKTS